MGATRENAQRRIFQKHLPRELLAGLAATLSKTAPLALACVLASGCSRYFRINGVPGLLSSNSAASTLKFQCSNPVTRGFSENQLHRLTRGEIQNTLGDLLGSQITSDSAIATQFELLLSDVIQISVTDVAPSPPDSQPDALLTIASRAAELIAASAPLRNQIYGDCSAQTPVPDPCAQAFITGFGLRALRRPLTPQESASFLATFKSTGGVEGLGRVLMRVLLSPDFAFHVENGAGTTNGRVRLTDFEIASRLSYRLAGTLPDTELFRAAGAGELQTLAAVKAQAKRLLTGNPLAKAKVADFFRFYLHLDEVSSPFQAAATADGMEVTGLHDEFVQEAKDFIDYIVWKKNGRFQDLLTSTAAFPRSARLMKIFETPSQSDGITPVATSAAHAGIVLRPAALAGSDSVTKPFHRSAQIRKGLLCEVLGSPDPNAVAAQQMALGDLSQLSNRDRLTTLTNVPKCLSCHSHINPVGFVLEGYDQLGMTRTVENSFDKLGAIAGGHPVDTRVGRTFLMDSMGSEVQALASGPDLVRVLAESPAARACFAQRVFEYQRVRPYTADDGCALSDVEVTTSSGGTILDVFLSSVANEDIFWKKGI